MIKAILGEFGWGVYQKRYYKPKNYGRLQIAPDRQPKNKVQRETVEKILDFFQKIPPFYSDDIIEPLKIGGQWKPELQAERKNQLQAIEERDVEKLEGLLNNMFRNEMHLGMFWDYFDQQEFNRPLPDESIEFLDGFRYLTGRDEEDLPYCDYGNTWGIETDKGLVMTNDVWQGFKAQNILNVINSFYSAKNKKITICDLGSGYGGDAEKVSRWFKKPLRIILVDIPLNLTTAFAYLSVLNKENTHLIDSNEELDRVLSKENDELEFILIPTIFVEKLKSIKINLLTNHGSLSEMDYPTIEFYLKTLVNENTDLFLEVNTDYEHNEYYGHREIPCSKFPIPESHSLLFRAPVWGTTKCQHRYVQSLHINKNLLK